MRKSHSFRNQLERNESIATQLFRSLFLVFASPSRMLLEVFIRKNFGERYFRFSAVLGLTALLTLIPFIPYFFTRLLLPVMWGAYRTQLAVKNAEKQAQNAFEDSPEPVAQTANEMPEETGVSTVSPEPVEVEEIYNTPAEYLDSCLPGGEYITWFFFVALFLGLGIRHLLFKMNNPSGLDFNKYSYYSGDRIKLFYNIKFPWFETTTRIVETLLEPIPFFLLGLLLYLIGQPLGMLLIISSIFYSGSYQAAYRVANNDIMDKIDEIIINRSMGNFLKEGFEVAEQEKMNNGSKTNYYEPRTRRPTDGETRRQILKKMSEDNQVEEAQ